MLGSHSLVQNKSLALESESNTLEYGKKYDLYMPFSFGFCWFAVVERSKLTLHFCRVWMEAAIPSGFAIHTM